MAQCATCEAQTTGKSKYCAPHRDVARQAWLEKINASGEDGAAKRAANAELYAKAHKAGQAAAEAHNPEPMHVVQRANPFDDNSPIIRAYEPVMGGVCGFAWVNVNPGNSSFALWLKKNNYARKAYQGGVSIWVSAYGQSMEKKEAYASAFAAVLKDAGIKAYAGSRMD